MDTALGVGVTLAVVAGYFAIMRWVLPRVRHRDLSVARVLLP